MLTPGRISDLLAEARARTLLLVAPVSEQDLRLQHSPLMSPIVWDLGHIAEFEQLWLVENLHGAGRMGEIEGVYDPFQNQRATRASLPLPTQAGALARLAGVREEVLRLLDGLDPSDGNPLLRQGFVFRMVLQHEYQHNETILQTLQLKLGEPYRAPLGRTFGRGSGNPSREMVRFPGGKVTLGSDDRGVSYDNERPAHQLEVRPFLIARAAVTNADYLGFMQGGGYGDQGLWSEAGWRWRQESDSEHPMHWFREDGEWRERFMDRSGPPDPDRPVCHVCFYEAEAFARWAGKRLPTEAEWEVACSWDPERKVKRLFPWGDDHPTWRHANLDQLGFGTAPVGCFGQNVSPLGCYGMIGDVWEWTSSDFGPYPGYETFPYREYSETFFGGGYKVLRGGSWATRPGSVRATFRNWDYPIRRQLFAGFRCAQDG